MALDLSSYGVARGGIDIRATGGLLRALVIVAGLGCSAAFIVIGLQYQLQTYGDGSLFSYAIGVQDAWAYHWHNISGRLTVYLLTCLPAEGYVALTGNIRVGLALYGLLFFGSQLLGLAATWRLDRSRGRVIFETACFSTACLCPMVFGFPTEMWMAHALFWPVMTLCNHGRGSPAGTAAVFMALLALAFTHEGALILAGVILAGLSLRGFSDVRFTRAFAAFLAVLAIWAIVKVALPPDGYDAPVMARAARHFFSLSLLRSGLLLLLFCALGAYGLAWLELRRLAPMRAHAYAAAIVATGLGVYWLWFDQSLHTEDRYYLRTVLLIGLAALGVVAGARAAETDAAPSAAIAWLRRLGAAADSATAKRAVCGAVLLIVLVHAVETAKFVREWTDYKVAVRALAMGATSDPALGDPRFVSAERIGADLNRLSWSSTTPYLSVLLAPDFRPRRLVIDPDEGYFWLTCRLATRNEEAARALPAAARSLVRTHACLHR